MMVRYNAANPITARLLEVKHLGVDYESAAGTVHAVTDVSFTLERGQVLGLAGESGSGKSTLAYAIARLLRPPAIVTEGEVLYYARDDDQSVDVLQLTGRQLRGFRWRELAIVFQSAMNALNPVMKLETQITDVLRAHDPQMGPDTRWARAIELMQLVGISPDRLQSYPHELSGGMRQRAIIAIALALNPELIIMDEPTTALDVVVQRDILIQILALRAKLGFSVIFITHDLSLLLEIADRVAIMYAGRFVETGTRKDLYHHPLHPYTCGLLNSFPSLHGPRHKMTGIAGSPPDLQLVPAGCAFHPRCAFAFDACRTVVPELLRPPAEVPGVGARVIASLEGESLPKEDVITRVATESCVACHLYDARTNPAGASVGAQFMAPHDGTNMGRQGAMHRAPTKREVAS